MWWKIVFLTFLALNDVIAYDCQQIPDSQIFDGNTVSIPGGPAQPIPPRYNCTYLIKLPANETDGLYAKVDLWNGMKGVNDEILVTLETGQVVYVDSYSKFDNNNTWTHFIIPGAYITVQVTTKSVLMNSMFNLTISYHAVKIRPSIPMKTGGEMNFFDMADYFDSSSVFNSVTFYSDDFIVYNQLSSSSDTKNMTDCYHIYGTLANQTLIDTVRGLPPKSRNTRTNSFTIAVFSSTFNSTNSLRFALNTVSELKPYRYLEAYQVPSVHNGEILLRAVEYLNFDNVGITIDKLSFDKPPVDCIAKIVSGPPNNSSELLLDLLTNPSMPYNFGLQYFTVITNCSTMYFTASPWEM